MCSGQGYSSKQKHCALHSFCLKNHRCMIGCCVSKKKKKKSYMLQQNWVFKSETAMTVAPKNSSYWMNMHQDYTLKYSLHMNNSKISYWPRELLPRWLKGLRGIKHSLRPLAVSLTKLETFGMLPDENEESGGINKGPQTWGRYHMQV